ncbi:MAG: lycopene cyclase domain-containing protein, partial [Bacteroidales bacterium]|nr:lycopene cyclase domain-containing protein [Bacteroidales bacterium]
VYTLVVFLVIAAYTVFSYIFARKVLQRYLAIFPVLFIPFLIVNGILTGTGIEQEVFSYDESRIIGVRIFTMPAEDGVYCFSLLLSVMVFTELIEGRSKKKKQT